MRNEPFFPPPIPAKGTHKLAEKRQVATANFERSNVSADANALESPEKPAGKPSLAGGEIFSHASLFFGGAPQIVRGAPQIVGGAPLFVGGAPLFIGGAPQTVWAAPHFIWGTTLFVENEAFTSKTPVFPSAPTLKPHLHHENRLLEIPETEVD